MYKAAVCWQNNQTSKSSWMYVCEGLVPVWMSGKKKAIRPEDLCNYNKMLHCMLLLTNKTVYQ